MNRLRHPTSLRVRLLVFLLAAIALTAAVQGLVKAILDLKEGK